MHSLPYYWDRVSNHGGIPTANALWNSVTTQNTLWWVGDGPPPFNSYNYTHFSGPYNPSMVYTAPGCSPHDFSHGGANALWMVSPASGFIPSYYETMMGLPATHWTSMRKSHNLYGITVDEALYGVGMPGVHPNGPSVTGQFSVGNLNPQTAILSANILYPAYEVLSSNITRDWAWNMWKQYNKLPFQQIDNGNPPNQCLFWIQTFVYYMQRVWDHTHGTVPNSFSNVQYNMQGNIADIWIYKYNMFFSKAHWAQTGSEACGCGGLLQALQNEFFISDYLGFLPHWAFYSW